ncbi:hemicentin-1-like isoform X1 [Leptotrombidium deliense]|uniref:Hemicentin-1-like isoform X1 n=1 Tax=Leptotrombidium deliense TaxID=299467 RepID=A0A443SVC7_9ACAR|nr:hemicentin-1-like isoform X1 [Leptotrombidium deliense]
MFPNTFKCYLAVEPKAPPKLIEALPERSGAVFNATNFSVSCRAECDPICDIYWKRNGELIDDNATMAYEIKQTIHPEEFELKTFVSLVSTLIWNMSYQAPLNRMQDNANYSCVTTENEVGPSDESSMMFFVEYPPENMTVNRERIQVNESDAPPPITCEADALPLPSFRWEFAGTTIADTSVLNISHSMGKEHSGNYYCIAHNHYGEARIEVLIDVLYKPVCSIFESKSMDEDAESFWLICESDANPNSDLQFTWHFGNDTYDGNNSTNIYTEGNRSKVRISTTSKDQFGEWICSITNSVGTSDPNCTLIASAALDKRQSTPQLTPTKDMEQQMIPGLTKDMYENMAFHRKKGMLIPLHLKPPYLPQYENIAQLTHELRRTQSARYYDKVCK